MDINKLTAELQEKYPAAGIQRIDYSEGNKSASFYIKPQKENLAFLKRDSVRARLSTASTINRTALDRSYLDLAISKSPYEEEAKDVFQRSIKYYFENDIYGASVDILSNFSSKGFENDIDDPDIKAFYDTWCFDVNFKQVLDWIFFDFFRVGFVRTYKIVGKYEPGITYMPPTGKSPSGTKQSKSFFKEISERMNRRILNALKEFNKLEKEYAKIGEPFPKELAAKKKMWSKGYMPVAFTVLNPLLVSIEGSLLFDKTKVTLQPSDELKKVFKKDSGELTDEEKEMIKLLPSEFKSQLEGGSSNIVLDNLYVGAVDYRKQPYERYPRPRGIKAFESLEYKKALREADMSTLDGISNYILKVTIGNDEYPVTTQSELETIAELFNNSSKAFDVVWNHTLQIEKIVSPEIESILGIGKYEQVNMDITGALAMSRAFFDGAGNVSPASITLIVKTVIEEIEYARRQVEAWIYHEYRLIAEAAGFEKFPKVRWDQTVLKDIIVYMSAISQSVDRRLISYHTALEQLGLNYDTELANMQEELPLVEDGVFGIIGSPWQQSKTQPVQGAPTGTPSSGRPKGQPTTPKKKSTDTTKKTKVPNQAPSQQPKTASFDELIKNMTDSEYAQFLEDVDNYRNNDI